MRPRARAASMMNGAPWPAVRGRFPTRAVSTNACYAGPPVRLDLDFTRFSGAMLVGCSRRASRLRRLLWHGPGCDGSDERADATGEQTGNPIVQECLMAFE